MEFLDRDREIERLERLSGSTDGGLAVVYGRRRVGKTRLLLEWIAGVGGSYSVADQSTSEIQREYLAASLDRRLPGFAQLRFRDWGGLLDRLARDAAAISWRGPLVLDELPYLVSGSPELPSVLQRWLDHQARQARLSVALAGSSQRMMQGLVLDRSSPLFGRAREILHVRPLSPRWLGRALGLEPGPAVVEAWTAWGGIPRYWELAAGVDLPTPAAVETLVLDPLGPLHREPDHLLLEEVPPAVEARPLLDAIGAGAHRVSEIAGRIGRPATSLGRPLQRLLEMGLVRRQVPFGESEKSGKRSLYVIDDPFLRLWFRVVAPHRAQLASSTPAQRQELLRAHWPALASASWEEICRSAVPRLGPWAPAQRWWHGAQPEWDVVSISHDGERALLGEVRWSHRPVPARELSRWLAELASRPVPEPLRDHPENRIARMLFVPAVRAPVTPGPGMTLVAADAVLAACE